MASFGEASEAQSVERLKGRQGPRTQSQDARQEDTKTRPKKKKSQRKKLYDLHAWVGFHLAVIMSLVLFTGTFATISQELDWLANPAMRVTPDGEKVSMQAMVEAVRVADPTSTIIAIFEGEADYFAYDVRVIDEAGVVKSKLVNPWTGEVTGEASFFNIKYFFRQLHRYLFLPAPIGLTIVCSMAIILSISLYTGLKTSRNWRTLMTRIRFAKGVRTAVGDAHKAAGLWSVWFFLLMIATGLWYYAEFLGTDFEPRQATFSEERAQEMGDLLVDRDVTEILAAAQSAYPDLQIQSITFGGVFGRTATMVDGTVGNPIVRDRANRVYLDPISLEVLHVARDRDLGWVQWLNQIADPLHFGNFGGLAVKLIWFVFGLFMTGLSISGVWLTWRRLKSRGASRTQLSVLPILVLAGIAGSITFVATKVPLQFGIDLFPLGWFVLGMWLGGLALIGLWLFGKRLKRASGRRVSLLNAVYAALILGAGASAVHATVLQNPFAAPVERHLGPEAKGPVAADLYLAITSDGTPSGPARLVIAGTGGRPNLKSMSVRLKKGDRFLDDEDGAVTRKFRVSALTQPAFFKLEKDQLASATHVEAVFEMQSGSQHALIWSLDQQ